MEVNMLLWLPPQQVGWAVQGIRALGFLSSDLTFSHWPTHFSSFCLPCLKTRRVNHSLEGSLQC